MARIIENPKELILETAKQLAYSEGLGCLNMRKIATQCDIALGTIYNYYPTKMDLMIAVIEDFWRNCFGGMRPLIKEELDFFQQLEVFYFYLLDYLEQFERNWLEELTSLSASNKLKGKAKEAEYMEHFTKFFKHLFMAKKHEFNPEIFESFSDEKIIGFILAQFFAMLRKFEHDYSFFDFTIKKILL